MDPVPGIDNDYSQKVLDLFLYQSRENKVYNSFLAYVNCDPEQVRSIKDIPFLPISLFKTQDIKSGDWMEEKVYYSSGTTQQIRSKHYVKSVKEYLSNAVYGFETQYGSLSSWRVLAYLPGYTENPSSSLIEMVNHFIQLTESNGSKLIAFDQDALFDALNEKNEYGGRTLLLGVSHALLDFALNNKVELNGLVVMETGGMKGMKEELTRTELHTILKNAFGVDMIHSEYGMTELFSQAYSKGGGIFKTTDNLRLIIKDPTDPMEVLRSGRHGVIHVIDLANKYTCAFIATEDLGKVYDDGSFELLGRMDISDVRGCNLLYYS